MESKMKIRSERKRRAITEAATQVFLDKGYDRTSMDDVAARAKVSKPTVYNHFADKERLFSEIVRTTTDRLDSILAKSLAAFVHLEPKTQPGTGLVEEALIDLAFQLVTAFMQPQLLRLRRLVIANANRFPEVRRIWHEQGWDRFISTLASWLKSLSDQGLLRLDDPLLAANHFVALLLWIPMNEAMFGGDKCISSKAELEECACTAVNAFLTGYGGSYVRPDPAKTRGKRPAGKRILKKAISSAGIK